MRRLFLAGLLVLLGALPADGRRSCIPNPGQPTLPHPQCPWVNGNNNWRDYIAGRYPNPRCPPGPNFYVRFEHMRQIPDSPRYEGPNDPIGPVWKGNCVVIAYHIRDQFWRGAAFDERIGRGSQFEYRRNLADPDRNEIAILGRVFTFEPLTGEVYDNQLGRVGQLYCDFNYSACDQYADPPPRRRR